MSAQPAWSGETRVLLGPPFRDSFSAQSRRYQEWHGSKGNFSDRSNDKYLLDTPLARWSDRGQDRLEARVRMRNGDGRKCWHISQVDALQGAKGTADQQVRGDQTRGQMRPKTRRCVEKQRCTAPETTRKRQEEARPITIHEMCSKASQRQRECQKLEQIKYGRCRREVEDAVDYVRFADFPTIDSTKRR